MESTQATPKRFSSKFYYKMIAKLINEAPKISKHRLKVNKMLKVVQEVEEPVSKLKKKLTNKELIELSTLTKDPGMDGFSYLGRILEFSDFPSSVLIMSALSLLRVITSSKVSQVKEGMVLKLFAACLNISQKLIMDDDWIMDDFSSLTGFKKKSISDLEQFLLNEIFGFRMNHNKWDYKKFKKWLENFDSMINILNEEILKEKEKKKNEKKRPKAELNARIKNKKRGSRSINVRRKNRIRSSNIVENNVLTKSSKSKKFIIKTFNHL